MGKLSKIAQFSAYGRAEDHLVKQTITGALVTIIGVALMSILGYSEISDYFRNNTSKEMYVDTRMIDTVQLQFDLTFPATPCTILSVDILDVSGTTEIDVMHDIYKQRLDNHGAKKGMEPAFRFDIDKYREQKNLTLATENERARLARELSEGEGCSLTGKLTVKRVGSTVHIGVNAFSSFLLAQVFPDPRKINVSHTVEKLQFGPDFPGRINPLDGTRRILPADKPSGVFKYFVQVVPTDYVSGWRTIPTNQYSVTEYFMPSLGDNYNDLSQVPGVYIFYDFLPIRIQVSDNKIGFSHLLVRLCAVIGGAFALTGLLDKIVFNVVGLLSGQQGFRNGGDGRYGSSGQGILGAAPGPQTSGPGPAYAMPAAPGAAFAGNMGMGMGMGMGAAGPVYSTTQGPAPAARPVHAMPAGSGPMPGVGMGMGVGGPQGSGSGQGQYGGPYGQA